METVLVTGASGFLGQVVVKRLVEAAKYNVVAVVSGRRSVEFPVGAQIEKCNLLDEHSRANLIKRVKPEILCHLAWGQETQDYRKSASNLEWLEASCSLLRAFVAANGRRFVYAGSCTEYDDYNGKMQEHPSEQAMSLYGECKRAFYHVMRTYCEIAGTQYVDARLFTIYGPGDSHAFGAIPSTICAFLRNDPVVCKAPNTVRDYIYVDDAAASIERIVDSDYCGAVNISSGLPISMRTIFTTIAEQLDCKELLSFEHEADCAQVLVGENNILREIIGMDSFSKFEKGIKETIRWWRYKSYK